MFVFRGVVFVGHICEQCVFSTFGHSTFLRVTRSGFGLWINLLHKPLTMFFFLPVDVNGIRWLCSWASKSQRMIRDITPHDHCKRKCHLPTSNHQISGEILVFTGVTTPEKHTEGGYGMIWVWQLNILDSSTTWFKSLGNQTKMTNFEGICWMDLLMSLIFRSDFLFGRWGKLRNVTDPPKFLGDVSDVRSTMTWIYTHQRRGSCCKWILTWEPVCISTCLRVVAFLNMYWLYIYNLYCWCYFLFVDFPVSTFQRQRQRLHIGFFGRRFPEEFMALGAPNLEVPLPSGCL